MGRKRLSGKGERGGQKKACFRGKGKVRGKGKGKAQEESKLWGTSDPGNTCPDFAHEFGPTMALPFLAAPMDYLSQVYPAELIDMLVEQTNLYAEQRGVSGWVETTAGRLRHSWGLSWRHQSIACHASEIFGPVTGSLECLH